MEVFPKPPVLKLGPPVLKMGQASPQPVVHRSQPDTDSKPTATNQSRGVIVPDESFANRRGQRKVIIFKDIEDLIVFTNHSLSHLRPVTAVRCLWSNMVTNYGHG